MEISSMHLSFTRCQTRSSGQMWGWVNRIQQLWYHGLLMNTKFFSDQALITIVNGVYKPTYNWGAPHCMIYWCLLHYLINFTGSLMKPDVSSLASQRKPESVAAQCGRQTLRPESKSTSSEDGVWSKFDEIVPLIWVNDKRPHCSPSL